MDEQMRTGMLEATRLTRAGRLLEATAAIQRTLRGMSAPHAGGEPIGQPAEQVIEGEFWVSVPAPHSTQAGTQEPERRMSATIVTALPPPSASTRPQRADSSAQRTSSQASPPPAPSSIGNLFLGQERAAATPPAFWPAMRQDHTGQTVGSGARFLTGSYTNAAGTRAYKLYIPSGYRGQALPLVVMLHGCTQTPDDFAAGTRMNEYAEEQGFFVAYPAQASSANRSKCWNWFKLSDQSREQGEPSLIAGITRQIGSSYAVDPRRVYVAGLSAGGAMAAIMGMTYADLYAAIGIHSGLAFGIAHDLPSALATMQHGAAAVIARNSGIAGAPANTRVVPMIVFHGDRDTTVNPRNAEQLIAQWAALHTSDRPNTTPEVRMQRGQVPGGQAYIRVIYHDRNGQAIMEQWLVHGAGHAWSGGSPSGSFTNPNGPDATQEMLRFFAAHPRPVAGQGMVEDSG